jgi:thiol-disulfide isomerase/thioredoxin
MKRRSLLLGSGVGAAAALTGAGVAWWRLRPEDGPLPGSFWESRFARPEGGELVLADFRGKRLALNFWATWCPPCVTELPLLDAFHREESPRGWAVVGLAVDSPTPVREFLLKRPLAMPVGLAGLDGVEFGRSLGNAQGGLPFTIVIDRAGTVRRRHLGALKEPDLAAWKLDIA